MMAASCRTPSSRASRGSAATGPEGEPGREVTRLGPLAEERLHGEQRRDERNGHHRATLAEDDVTPRMTGRQRSQIAGPPWHPARDAARVALVLPPEHRTEARLFPDDHRAV